MLITILGFPGFFSTLLLSYVAAALTRARRALALSLDRERDLKWKPEKEAKNS